MKKVLAIALVVVLMLGVSMTVFAAESPSAKTYNKVTVVDGVAAKADVQTVEEGKTVELKADSKKGTFNSWKVYQADGTPAVLNVHYTLADNTTLNSSTLKIVPLANLIITGNYNNKHTSIKVENGEVTSPSTGDAVTAILAVLAMVSLAGTYVAKKQFAK